MATIDEHAVRRLASLKSADGPVVSLYLDVDGRRWPRWHDCEARAQRLMKRASERSSPDAKASELKRIMTYLRGGIDRHRTRGLAVFAGGSDLWEVFELPVAVHDQLVVNQTPHVRQLEAVLDSHHRLGVLLADRQRARLFVFDVGELIDRTELFDALPRHEDEVGSRDRGGRPARAEPSAGQHLKRAAAAAFAVWQERNFDHLVVGAPEDLQHELEAMLHPYLRERLAGRIAVPVTASENDIVAAALDVGEQVERARQAATVDRLRGAVGSGAGGVAGLDPVLAALADRRVDTLLVSVGFDAPGWQCECGRLATVGPRCPVCEKPMTRQDDVVELALDEALLQSCRIVVSEGNADLDVMGRIGALLRF